MRRFRIALLTSLLLSTQVLGATTTNSPSIQALPQPAFPDLSGSAACSQLPALSGAITSSAGSCATSLATSGAAPVHARYTTGSGATYNTPANATLLWVFVCGGGGGGGGGECFENWIT